MRGIKIITWLVLVPMLAASFSAPASGLESNPSPRSAASGQAGAAGYFDYYNKYSTSNAPEGFVELGPDDVTPAQSKVKIKTLENTPAVILDETRAACEWQFDIAEDGIYRIALDYYPLPNSGKNIILSLSLDGSIPYSDCENITLPRIWRDDLPEDQNFEKDNKGNDIRPMQVEVQGWTSTELYDPQGLYPDAYLFFLTAGTHRIGIKLVREAVAIGKIKIGNAQMPPSYDEYIRTYSNVPQADGETVLLQAERPYLKNNKILYATYDRIHAATIPNTPSETRLNTIGQSNWSNRGDSISWIVDVPQPGLYKIAFKARQNYNQGMVSYRTLKINGEIPFAQAENIPFEYAQKWYVKAFGDEEPYLVYLKKGDILTLTCSAGEISEVLRNIYQALSEFNALYREIIAVTSADPDVFRDYMLEQQIPHLEKSLKTLSDFILGTGELAANITGTKGSQASVLSYVGNLLDTFSAEPYTIPERLSTLKDALERLGSLILTLSQQPLELDYIAFVPENGKMPEAKASVVRSAAFSIKRFLSSFLIDYSSISSNADSANVSVWVSSGRDQVKILNRLIENKFSVETGIQIDLNLVDTGATLIKASLAGKGPDAALYMPMDTPMNLAARGALLDLSKYDLSDIRDSFYPASWNPFWYQNGLYALPETQTFDMMFYRTDIFDALGLEAPETWDDFYKVAEVLQKNNLMVGIPEINRANLGVSAGVEFFNKLFLQKGGTYYNDTLTATNFDTEIAYQAFETWTRLYTDYGFDREYDFYSRFRTGEMPLGIQNYTAYNQLMKAAPELHGLWEMVPVPGTKNKNGLDRSQTGAVTGCVMLKSARKKGIEEEAFRFLKWWVSAAVQTEYGLELEASLGVAARHTPASKEALAQMGWSAQELAALKEGMSWVRPQPEVPGNYIIPRSLTSAFRSVLAGTNLPRRALTIYNKDINDELARKHKEFS